MSVINNVRKTYEAMPYDESVIKAVQYLTTLAVSAKGDDQVEFLKEHGFSVNDEISLFSLIRNAKNFVTTENGSLESNKIARDALLQAIASYERSKDDGQISLFGEKSPNVWADIGSGAAFCELARGFFAAFTDRYLRYYLERENEKDIISSSVSCSSTRNKPTATAHCGCCSQCIDRIFAIYATGLEEYDATYADNFITHIPTSETRQRLYNTLRLAAMEKMKTKDDFMIAYINELDDIIDYIPGNNPDDKMDELYKLFCRFGASVLYAAKRMQDRYEDLTAAIPKDSMLEMLARRDHLVSPTLSRVLEIDKYLRIAIPMMFQRTQPTSENDLNDKIQALLSTKGDFEREYPVLQFGTTSYKADHSQDVLLIEAKYIRGKTSPSVASGGIAGDITQIPNEFGLYFTVYDPERQIIDDDTYIRGFEAKRENCYVRIYR